MGEREADLARRRRHASVSGKSDTASSGFSRPGSGARLRTAAEVAETMLQLSASLGRSILPGMTLSEGSLSENRTRNAVLRRELERVQAEIVRLRKDACSVLLGRDFSPPPRE